jgi:hypothetical protein
MLITVAVMIEGYQLHGLRINSAGGRYAVETVRDLRPEKRRVMPYPMWQIPGFYVIERSEGSLRKEHV